MQVQLEKREIDWLVAACDLVVKQVGLQAAQQALEIATKLQKAEEEVKA